MSNELTEAHIRTALEQVIDPEVGVNIMDLGLVYEVMVDDEHNLRVTMTMTTPACPMSSYLQDEVKQAIRKHLPMVKELDVRLVWDPPWEPSMMSEKAKRQLGWSH